MLLTLLLVLAMFVIVGGVFALGLRLGSDRQDSELSQLRLDTALAKRRMHDLTRQAFVAMTEEAQRRVPPFVGDRIDPGR